MQRSFISKGFSYTVAKEFSPRLDAGVPVPGYLFILEKNRL